MRSGAAPLMLTFDFIITDGCCFRCYSISAVFVQPAQLVPIVFKPCAERPLFTSAASLNKLPNAPYSFVKRSASGGSECRLLTHLPPFNGRFIKPLLHGQHRLKRAAFQNKAAMRRKKHSLGWEIRIADARAKIFRYP